MNSQTKDMEEDSSSPNSAIKDTKVSDKPGNEPNLTSSKPDEKRPPAKRPAPAVIEISDSESDDSDICAVTSYQASADEVKKIRGDYSSSSSSSSSLSSDYSSDSDQSVDDDSIVIKENTKVHCINSHLNPRANRMDVPVFNSKINSTEIIEKLSQSWKLKEDIKLDDVTFTTDPFRLFLLHNVILNPEIINNIVDDMNTLDWTRKKLDLYEFHQTADLASLTWQRSIRGIYDLLKTDVMKWVSSVMGVELTSVSASCSLYGPGDRLLVHDDLQSDRRVAFILYLCPWSTYIHHNSCENGDTVTIDETEAGWCESMGGALELFDADKDGRPHTVSKTVLPHNNMIALFQVSKLSFHQVSEVLSLEVPRLSINGWYHGPARDSTETAAAIDTIQEQINPPVQNSLIESEPTEVVTENDIESRFDLHKPHSNVVLITEWVSGTYMTPTTRNQIAKQMEEHSEVSLQDFFTQEKYHELLDALKHPNTPWERCGPADLRHCDVISPEWSAGLSPDHVVKAVLDLVTATPYFRLLVDCTDLKILKHAPVQLQRWTTASYELIPPSWRYNWARLESVIYLGVGPMRPCGGDTVFTVPEETESGALVSIPPIDNALNLVYCDTGAASFTRYVSKLSSPFRTNNEYFYTLSCVYAE